MAIPHFQIFRRDRDRHGGGVAFYCHESLHVRRRKDLESDNLELIWIEVQAPGSTSVLGCGYRPPSKPMDYWVSFANCIERAMEGRQASTILLGDFNVDMSDQSNHQSSHLKSLLSLLGLTNLVQAPTRVTSGSATLIDLLLSSCSLSGRCEVIPLDISDHFAVLARLSAFVNFSQRKSRTRLSRPMHRIDWAAFNEDLRQELSTLSASWWTETDVNVMIDDWYDTIFRVLEKHSPLREVRCKVRRPCPWLTDELVRLVRKRNKLHKMLMKDQQNDALRAEHKQARSAARRLDRRLKSLYFMEQCKTSDQRKLWRVINTVTGRSRITQDPKASIRDLSTVFGTVVTDPNRPATLPLLSGPMEEHSLSSFTDISLCEVEALLASVDIHKAMGSDELPPLILKQCATVLAPSLLKIFSSSLASGVVPKAFKLSFVSPLYKGGDACVPSNYRPVSLLPVVSRLLERLVKERLIAFLSTNDLLPATQFAYRPKHSTEDALTLAVNRWTQAKAAHLTTGVVLVDMSKAFDRVQHERLLSVLFSMGIGGTVLQWFGSYLSERLQRVKVSQDLAPEVSCSRGVPQGSVLGPLLFLLYTSDISCILPQRIFHQEFADDILLDYSSKDPGDIANTLSDGVSRLANWLSDIGLLLNEKKTQVMFIPPRGLTPPVDAIVTCRNIPLVTVKTVKYLGLIIDNDLAWTTHVDHLAARSRKATSQLWRHCNSLSTGAKRAWYVSIIQSSLCYSSNAFFPSLSATHLRHLIRMSKAAVRAVCAVHLPASTAPLLQRLDLRPLIHVLLEKVLLFVFRCIHGSCSKLFKDFFLGVGSLSSVPRATRGEVSRLLIVPFVPGPSGRSLVRFQGSVMWNHLPANIRQIETRMSFTDAIKSYHDHQQPLVSSALLYASSL